MHDTSGGGPAREALTIDEAAAACGIGRSTLYSLIDSGEGPPTLRIRRRRLVPIAGLRRWLADLEAAQADARPDLRDSPEVRA